MKKILSFILVLLFCFSLAACNISDKGNEPENPDVNEPEKPENPNNPSKPENSNAVGFVIHYARLDADYSTWCLWLWEMGKEGKIYEFDNEDDFGASITLKFADFSSGLSSSQLGIIVRQKSDWIKDFEADRFITFSKYTLDANGYYHVYILSGEEPLYSEVPSGFADKITMFAFTYNKTTNETTLKFLVNQEYESYSITKDDVLLVSSQTHNEDEGVISVTKLGMEYSFGNTLPDILSQYKLTVKFKESQAEMSKLADLSALYSTKAFNDSFAYDGELGAIYSLEKTVFRVWSPVSSLIKLRIYSTGTPASLRGSDNFEYEYTMEKKEKGVWEYTALGDLEGKYYTYVVSNPTYDSVEIVDPYAKSTGVNGLRGMVVDFAKTNPEGWDDVKIHEYDSTQLVVYETHIADLTSSSTWNGPSEKAKLYTGFYQAGTSYNGVTTGFDHIKELGVNAVQLLPIFDQDNNETVSEFNWGYNPLNYNALDGIYSSDPYDGYKKISEFKELVKAYNEAGINIIMDVVYNHVSNHAKSNFDVLMPKYYFRYLDSKASNGSGCGNETASENYMFQKFMIDSTEFWASEYKLGGFRFDLMALHDIETMNKLAENLHDNVNEYITVYGEPWAGGTSPLASNLAASQANMHKYEGYGCFNDQMRDALIKGGMCGVSETGWITNTSNVNISDIEKIIIGIKGKVLTSSSIYDSYKTVNYVTCHDNYTLYDRIKAAGITDEAKVKNMAMLANSVVLTSQGITFILAGEEFLRTKGGDHNSYQSSYAVNQLDYSLKVKHQDMFNNYKALIALKKNGNLFGLTGDAAKNITINFNDNKSMMWYDLVDTANNVTYRIVHSNGVSGTKSVNLEGYSIYLDTLNSNVELKAETIVADYQTIIAKKSLN